MFFVILPFVQHPPVSFFCLFCSCALRTRLAETNHPTAFFVYFLLFFALFNSSFFFVPFSFLFFCSLLPFLLVFFVFFFCPRVFLLTSLFVFFVLFFSLFLFFLSFLFLFLFSFFLFFSFSGTYEDLPRDLLQDRRPASRERRRRSSTIRRGNFSGG